MAGPLFSTALLDAARPSFLNKPLMRLRRHLAQEDSLARVARLASALSVLFMSVHPGAYGGNPVGKRCP